MTTRTQCDRCKELIPIDASSVYPATMKPWHSHLELFVVPSTDPKTTRWELCDACGAMVARVVQAVMNNGDATDALQRANAEENRLAVDALQRANAEENRLAVDALQRAKDAAERMNCAGSNGPPYRMVGETEDEYCARRRGVKP